MKILILSHKFFPDIGGIETISEILANAFYKAGHEVRLLTWSSNSSAEEFAFLVIRKPNVIRLFKEHLWADMVFENNPCLRLAWPILFSKRPLVIGIHTWIKRLDGTIGWKDRLKFQWLKRAKKVIACSEAIKNGSCSSSIVIGNPYQEHIFKIHPDTSRTREFIFLGRLVSDKGIDLAISAFHTLITSPQSEIQSPSKLRFTIVGDGPEREPLHKMVVELGLEKNIVFTGALRGENLVRILNQHRFILVPSLWEEPFGVVALEGMACGCVPIVSDGGGLPDAIGKAGLTFQTGNVLSLVECMLKVLNCKQLEEDLRRASIIHLNSHRSAEVSKRYLSILESIRTNQFNYN